MKKIYTAFYICIFIATSSIFYGSSSGRDDNRSGAPGGEGTCAQCHTTTGTGTVVLTGVPAAITLGQTYTLTLTINEPNNAQSVAGFQIMASNGITPQMQGSFTASAGTRVTGSGRLTQSSAKAIVGNTVSWTFDWTAPTTTTNTEFGFFYAVNSANGNGSNGSGDFAYNGNVAELPLPVEWVYFDVNENGKKNILTWATASESNSFQYIIERSATGTNFREIEIIDAAFSSNDFLEYSYEDKSFLPGSNYYRIKQVDIDGSYEYSKTKLVTNRELEPISIYPTLVRDVAYVQNSVEGSYYIYSYSGQMLASGESKEAIDLSSISPGIYVIQFSNSRQEVIHTQKFIKG